MNQKPPVRQIHTLFGIQMFFDVTLQVNTKYKSIWQFVRVCDTDLCVCLFLVSEGLPTASRLLSYMSTSTRSHRQDVDNILQNSTSLLISLFLSVSLHLCMPTLDKDRWIIRKHNQTNKNKEENMLRWNSLQILL